MVKCESRIPNVECRNKSQMQSSNVPNHRVVTRRVWSNVASPHLNLFRVSDLVFRISSHFSLAAVLIVVFALRAACAAPPDFAQVPADAVWIVHADFDSLHKSTVYEKLAAAALARWKPLAAHLAKVNRQLGMDLAKDLHGMTVFGPTLAEPKAMLVMRADWDPQTFRQRLALAQSHAVSTVGQYEIHRFTRQDEGQLRTVAGACWRPGTFLFSQTPADVQTGLDVLDGRRAHLAGRGSGHNSALAADVPPGTVLMARMVISGEALPVESPLLKQTDEIDLACGENAGECFARAKLLAKTPEAASQVKKAVDGILVIVKLQTAKDAKAGKLLDRLTVRVDGRTVQADFRAPSAELATVLEKAMREPDGTSGKKD
jgi:hypothetical protein